jgi:hypothetical protein
MKFQKLENINFRNETKKYFETFINFNKGNLYYGIINNLFCILLSVNAIPDEIELEFPNGLNCIKLKYQGIESTYNSELLDKILSQPEKFSDKFIEIISPNYYIRFSVSTELIDWLKADTEIFTETYQNYKKISLPYINSVYDKNTKWIHDLVLNYSEESIVLFRNQDMVLCKDIVWKDDIMNQFYILGIPTKKIKTIRNLTSNDIPLLKSIRDKAIEIAQQFGINKNKLYMFFHYHPSYYQLHLHICVTEHEALETKYWRNYYLDDVIDKLESDSNYWKKSTLKFELLSNTKLFKLLKEYII